jgi:hypothetical protein
MIHIPIPKILTWMKKRLKRKLQIQTELATIVMKSFLEGKYFSVTLDHWTSMANENGCCTQLINFAGPLPLNGSKITRDLSGTNLVAMVTDT